jgi:hypothetical protein
MMSAEDRYYRFNLKHVLILLCAPFFLAMSFVIISHLWSETVTSTTQLELDIRTITPFTQSMLTKEQYPEKFYVYEDDKILIHSTSNNYNFVYDENSEIGSSSPDEVYGRAAKYLDRHSEMNVWLKPKLTLVYHSKINRRYPSHAYPRTQDKYRKELIFHKGLWVKYINSLADLKREQLHEGQGRYRLKKELKKIEDGRWQKQKAKELKLAEEKEKAEYEEAKRKEKELHRKNTEPIDDSDIFK